MLSGQTLEMLADMRLQFAAMLADIGFISAPRGALNRGKGSNKNGGGHWVDDRKAAWNAHSSKPAVVRRFLPSRPPERLSIHELHTQPSRHLVMDGEERIKWALLTQ